MKRIKLLLLILLIGSANAMAANGNLYLKNVNDIQHHADNLKFKVIVRDEQGRIVKDLITKSLLPGEHDTFTNEDLAISRGSLDFLIKDVTHDMGYILCQGHGYPYFKSIIVIVHGWSYGNKIDCNVVED